MVQGIDLDYIQNHLNASKSSEHLPSKRGEMSKPLDANNDCKGKNISWDLTGFANISSIGSIVKYRGKSIRYSVHLYQLPDRYTKKKTKTYHEPRYNSLVLRLGDS